MILRVGECAIVKKALKDRINPCCNLPCDDQNLLGLQEVKYKFQQSVKQFKKEPLFFLSRRQAHGPLHLWQRPSGGSTPDATSPLDVAWEIAAMYGMIF